MASPTELLGHVSGWQWALAIVLAVLVVMVLAICGFAYRRSVARRQAVLKIVGKDKGSDDQQWRHVHVFRVPRHVWVVVPLQMCDRILRNSIDAANAGDQVARLWNGTSSIDPQKPWWAAGGYVFTITFPQRGRR